MTSVEPVRPVQSPWTPTTSWGVLENSQSYLTLAGASAQGGGGGRGAAAAPKKLGRGRRPPLPQTKKHRKAQKNDESALRAKEVIIILSVCDRCDPPPPPPQSKFGADAPASIASQSTGAIYNSEDLLESPQPIRQDDLELGHVQLCMHVPEPGKKPVEISTRKGTCKHNSLWKSEQQRQSKVNTTTGSRPEPWHH